MKYKYYILFFLLSFSIRAQNFQNAPEIATAGAFLGGGNRGTHSIHANPSLLGIKEVRNFRKIIGGHF